MVAKFFPDFSGYSVADGRYQLLEPLGSGSYGRVYKAVDTHSTNFVAIKCIKKSTPGSRQEALQNREFAFHHQVGSHPNIITFHGRFFAGDYIFVVLDLCEAGDLFRAIKKRNYFVNNDDRVKRAMVQLIDALQYCHDHDVFHRDIKPENILFDQEGQLYLADFGLCTDKSVTMDFGCGTRIYLAPECVNKISNRQPISTIQADVWALGVTFVNMLTRISPWRQALPSDKCYAALMNDPEFLFKVLIISEEASSILQGIFTPNPMSRTSLQNLRQEILSGLWKLNAMLQLRVPVPIRTLETLTSHEIQSKGRPENEVFLNERL
ncbi:kinase-like domain-containing protein [Mycena floridula]|nr:kinase-like domain-containing protein [Mycena floridula]